MHADELSGCIPAKGFYPLLDDLEGDRVPSGVELIDSHVHIFPPGVFEAIWRWFDKNAWPVRYRLHAEEVLEFLSTRGVKRVVGLAYAHVPGMARELNRYMSEVARAHPELIPLATVLPGEPDAREVLYEALGSLGLRGVKLHCHVQRMAADDPRTEGVYAICEEAQVPVVIHCGREPSFPAYGVDARALCAASQMDRVLTRHPKLTVVVPHLGADEFEDYEGLLARHENLWLDTTMTLNGYFPAEPPESLFPALAKRLLFGTDFPNLPYAWDRELRRALAAIPDDASRRALLSGNALKVFGG